MLKQIQILIVSMQINDVSNLHYTPNKHRAPKIRTSNIEH